MSVVMTIACAAVMLAGCGNKTKSDETTAQATESSEAVSKEESSAEVEPESSVKKMLDQGNPHKVVLGEIAEEDKSWIKVSTAFDETLSMYSCDSISQGVTAVVVDFEVSGLETESATVYWCYMVDANGETISLWDDTSTADRLEITEDGKYRIVFDTRKALGAPMDSIQSLQLVFTNVSEETKTELTVESAGYVTDEDISSLVSGKL